MLRSHLKSLAFVFYSAFWLNLAWENIHSFFYLHYQGQAITFFVLARAALFDALVITLLAGIFLVLALPRNRLWLSLPIGSLFSTALELYALETARWAYSASMPTIPLLGVAWSPVIQLGLIAYLLLELTWYFFPAPKMLN